jgi:hypothetical protein
MTGHVTSIHAGQTETGVHFIDNNGHAYIDKIFLDVKHPNYTAIFTLLLASGSSKRQIAIWLTNEPPEPRAKIIQVGFPF